jgi:hypothetical protein
MNGLPMISKCEETDCFYNRDSDCHAAAIKVGDTHPRCDTFARAGSKHIGRQPVGMDGGCLSRVGVPVERRPDANGSVVVPR